MTKQEMIDILRGKRTYTGERWQQAKDVQNDFDEIADFLECSVPVVHGHWDCIDDDSNVWRCSVCGEDWVLEAVNPIKNDMHYEIMAEKIIAHIRATDLEAYKK